MHIMDELEAEKPAVAGLSNDEARNVVSNYAMLLFKKADDKEVAGVGDKITLQLFYVASLLMEVTKQFGDMEPDIQEKQQYAKWKAADIKKCLDQGIPYTRPQVEQDPPPSDTHSEEQGDHQQQPSYYAPPPGDHQQQPSYYAPSLGDNQQQPSYYAPPLGENQQQPSYYAPPLDPSPDPARTSSPLQPQAHTSHPKFLGAPPNGPSFEAIQEAQKYAKWVVSALQFSDVNTALQYLHISTELLQRRRQPGSPH
eukprot:NODE_2454_length_1172_cov_10.474641_g2338_i0.p1 GENE.NODE_2454_length_1172_cov_10.474641_g2338_i0~~NODE_2454_length_1172_cov_10.474641_g2338_i0.p1  ORF type:complete len:254 (+),score=57.93 NODE_2454_length_1172_cov_10.474641_g2338_i0:231-992(+)